MKKVFQDPYIYPGTDVLKNKFNITDGFLLEIAESSFLRKRLARDIPQGQFNYEHLKAIHKHIFQDVYEWAGQERTIGISKKGNFFTDPPFIASSVNKLLDQLREENYLMEVDHRIFIEKIAIYFGKLNAIHPFREGNGRAQRLFFDLLAKQAGYQFNWDQIDRDFYIEANIKSFQGEYDSMQKVFTIIAHRENVGWIKA
jgi:cell filamentation protein